MKLQQECVGCILGQADRVASIIGANPELTQTISNTALAFSKDFSFSHTPPEVATPLYEAIAKDAKMLDLYREAKAKATREAETMRPRLQAMILNSKNVLVAAAKMAVAGNVIDLATQHEYDLEKDVQEVLNAEFGVDNLDELFAEVAEAKTLLYLADNAGEHVFDGLFMQVLKRIFPMLTIHYVTRENAIINDVTLEEADASGLGQYAILSKSGCTTPGFIHKNASSETQALFDVSDVVIAKGMGNFETMTEMDSRTVYHLFKVKCNVVAQYVGHELGRYMAMKR